MTCLANEAKNSTPMYIRFKPTNSTEYGYVCIWSGKKSTGMINNFTRVSIPNLYNWYPCLVSVVFAYFYFHSKALVFTFTMRGDKYHMYICLCILTFTSHLEFFLTKWIYSVVPRTNSYSHFVNEFKLWVRVHAVMFIRYLSYFYI